MASNRPVMCERCGHYTVGKVFPVPLKQFDAFGTGSPTSMFGLICAQCKEVVHRLYVVEPVLGVTSQLELFPALSERLI